MRRDRLYWLDVYLALATRYAVADGRRRIELAAAMAFAASIYRRTT